MADEYSAKISAIRDVLRLLDASYVGLSRPEIERPEIERSKPPEVTAPKVIKPKQDRSHQESTLFAKNAAAISQAIFAIQHDDEANGRRGGGPPLPADAIAQRKRAPAQRPEPIPILAGTSAAASPHRA